MINRDGEFSPKGKEQPVMKERPLSEATFLEFARDQMESSGDEVSAIRDLVGVVSSGKMNMRVSNLRDGITYPILDYMALTDNEEKAVSTRRHKENVLNLIDVKRSIERTAAQSNETMTGSIRETYYNLTKSMVSAIGTVIKPIFKAAGFLLFGTGKKERTAVQAIDEQTRFMRTGFIEDQTTMFGRFMRRGLVGSAVAGAFTGLTGIGRGSSQSIQDKRSKGEDLNFTEKMTDKLSAFTGWFSDVDKKDTRASSGQNDQDIRQVELLKGIKDANNRTNFALSGPVVDSQMKIVDSIGFATAMITSGLKSSQKLLTDDMKLSDFKQYNVLEGIKNEMREVNSPLMSQYEQESLGLLGRQNEHLALANELSEEQAEAGKEKSGSGGGLIGMIAGLIFNKKAMGMIKTLGMRFVISPIMGAIKAGGSWIAKNGFKMLLRAPFAKVFAIAAVVGLFTKYLLRPIIDWFDTTFGTSIGKSIDKVNEWIAGKFTGIIDWIREKASNIPVIGRLFKSDSDEGGSDKNPATPKPKDEEGSGFFGSMMEKAKGVFTGENAKKVAGATPIGFLANKIGGLFGGNSGEQEEKRIVEEQSGKSGGLLSSITGAVEDAFSFAKGKYNDVRGNNKPETGSADWFREKASDMANDAMGTFGISEDVRQAAIEQKATMMEQLNELKDQKKETKEYSERMIDLMKKMVAGTEQAVLSPMMAAKVAEEAKTREQMLQMSDGYE